MDPNPLLVHHMIPTTVPTNHHHQHPSNLPGSADSTPRGGGGGGGAPALVVPSGQADCWGTTGAGGDVADPLPHPLPQVPGAKLRLMCSYGGHIIPRPHDKSLCYVGGETRMVSLDRGSSLADISTRLSRTLLDGRRFTLKYQLPNEDLDSLISVASDEDLDNMVDEYDRLMAKGPPGPVGPGRLRLFLFLAKPDTAKTMGVLLDDAKSETWFVDALNGADLLNRGLSDSAAIDDLLSLDSGVSGDHQQQHINTNHHDNHLHFHHHHQGPTTPTHDHVFAESDAAEQPKIAPQQEVQTIQSIMGDSPTVETNTSSFDSSTSSPSMAHLPPIRVREDDPNRPPPEDTKTTTGGVVLEQQFMSQLQLGVTVTPPLPTAILTPSPIVVTTAPATTTATANESNLHRMVSDDDHVAPVMLSRKPPLPLPLQPMHQRSGGFNLPHDSRHPGAYDLPSPDSVKSDSSIASSTASFSKASQPPQDQTGAQLSTFKPNNTETRTDSPIPTAQHQPTILQQPPQFIQHPNMHHHYIPSYYHPVYPNQHQQQSPMYLLPVTQTQPYNLAATESTVGPTNPGGLIQVTPSSAQFQQQYVGYSATGRPMAVSAVSYGNYDHQQQQQQVYYTGQMVPPSVVPVVGSQYQSITPAQAAMIAEASKQMPPSE